VKVLEGDAEVLKALEDTEIVPVVLESQTKLERHLGYDLETALVERRYAFMVMALVYIPCIAAIATIKRETNWKWTALAVGYSLVLGWGLAVLIYQIGAFLMTLK
jgi:Fe2+ transport system protein B